MARRRASAIPASGSRFRRRRRSGRTAKQGSRSWVHSDRRTSPEETREYSQSHYERAKSDNQTLKEMLVGSGVAEEVSERIFGVDIKVARGEIRPTMNKVAIGDETLICWSVVCSRICSQSSVALPHGYLVQRQPSFHTSSTMQTCGLKGRALQKKRK